MLDCGARGDGAWLVGRLELMHLSTERLQIARSVIAVVSVYVVYVVTLWNRAVPRFVHNP